MLVTFTNKWSARSKFTVHPDELAPAIHRRSSTANTKSPPIDIDPEELEGYRWYKKDLGIILRVLERHPAAIAEVRSALQTAVDERERDLTNRDPRKRL